MNTAIINLADEGMIYKNILVHYEIFIFDLSKVFRTRNIHFKFIIIQSRHECIDSKILSLNIAHLLILLSIVENNKNTLEV